MVTSFNCTIMRGGTSKGIFLRDADLPADAAERQRVILDIFGSPDRRQIDGLGGADPLTSKLAIIGESHDPEHDVVYTFGQVEIDEANIDWKSLCGNITAAVGLYAVQNGMVAAVAPLTTVRVFNTNLQRVLRVEVPVSGGEPVEAGSFRVPGVPGSGARIDIDFSQTAGAACGALLPTGNPVDRIEVEGVGSIEMSLVDTGNAHVFVRAADVGMTGTETAAEIDGNAELLARLERIRDAAAYRMGMSSGIGCARAETPATPILGVVSAPADYWNDIGQATVRAEDVDLVSRLQFMQRTHKTYAGTSTACTGVASKIPGTLVHQVSRQSNREAVRIGHPAGVIETESVIEEGEAGAVVSRATLGRTARRIMEGRVFLKAASRDVAK